MSLSVTYSVNGNSVRYDQLKKVIINKKDYIDYIEAIKKQHK